MIFDVTIVIVLAFSKQWSIFFFFQQGNDWNLRLISQVMNFGSIGKSEASGWSIF